MLYSGKPEIVIRQADHQKLSQLANALLERLPELADELLGEFERARVEPSAASDTVQMGTTSSTGPMTAIGDT